MSGYLLFETDSDWIIGPIGSSVGEFEPAAARDASPSQLADAVRRYCESRGNKADLVIAVHSTSVVAVTFKPSPSVKRTDRRALLFEMEPSLPFDAENVTADFSVGDYSATGVAIQTERLLPFIQDIESSGDIRVQSVFPTALGAAQQFSGSDGMTLWYTNGAFEVVAYFEDVLYQWFRRGSSPIAFQRLLPDLKILQEVSPEAFVTVLADSDEAPHEDVIAEFGMPEVASQFEHASQFAGEVVSGNATPWIELRRGALANGDPNRPFRKSLNWFIASAAALLILFSLVCWYRAGVYESQAQGFADEQRTLFKSVFPGIRTNAPISRLRSEHRRLMSSRQTNSDVQLPVSAIEPTVKLLAATPTDLKVRLKELRVEDGKFDLAAEVKSYEDASRLARSLEQSGFAVTPETQEQLDRGRISMKLRGAMAVEHDSTKGGRP